MSKAPKRALQVEQGRKNRSYLSGETIPCTGLFSVKHSAHRLPAEVTLRKGEAFPTCSACTTAVQFVLVKAAPAESGDTAFKVVLHALPVLDEGEAGAVAV